MSYFVTGATGFIGRYLVQELLDHGHEVVGIDNFSKYGPVAKSYDNHPAYRFVEGDAKDVKLLTELAADADAFIEHRDLGSLPRRGLQVEDEPEEHREPESGDLERANAVGERLVHDRLALEHHAAINPGIGRVA